MKSPSALEVGSGKPLTPRSLSSFTSDASKLMAEPDKYKRDIIRDYANYDSQVYAPITRLGSTMDRNAADFEAKPEILASLEGLMELEATLPRQMTTTMIKKPTGTKHADPAAARKDATLGKHLAFMDTARQEGRVTLRKGVGVNAIL